VLPRLGVIGLYGSSTGYFTLDASASSSVTLGMDGGSYFIKDKTASAYAGIKGFIRPVSAVGDGLSLASGGTLLTIKENAAVEFTDKLYVTKGGIRCPVIQLPATCIPGAIPFVAAGSPNLLSTDANFKWDNVNSRLITNGVPWKGGAGVCIGPNTTWGGGICIGDGAFTNNSKSVAIGSLSVSNGDGYATGGDCAGIAIGHAASAYLNSVSIGRSAGNTVKNAISIGAYAKCNTEYSIAVGYSATAGVTSGRSIAIGANVTAADGQIAIGTSTQTALYCYQAYSFNITDVTRKAMYADNTGMIGGISSSSRYKTNIRNYEETAVFDLRPVRFDYKDPTLGVGRIGLIAEEVVQHIPEVVCPDGNGDPETVNYAELTVPILAGIKHLVSRFDGIEGRIGALEA
jgi:hypothetical protein